MPETKRLKAIIPNKMYDNEIKFKIFTSMLNIKSVCSNKSIFTVSAMVTSLSVWFDRVKLCLYNNGAVSGVLQGDYA